MTSIDELVGSISLLQRTDLELWIRESLVVPESDGEDLRFSESECARVQLICTLRYALEVEQETLPLVMSLMDQLYETRGKFKAMAAAVAAQPPEVYEAVIAALRRSCKSSS